ncbi:MAG: ABC-F family ATP-binding cassette domain-containing protein [bacterium]|nr:ABC-F family ATP-binding cassette domain-containing protein [bacterium]
MHLVSLENISKSYPENDVLTEASLGISAAERIGVIGRNGSGKTTLLSIIAGSEEPDGGSIVRARGLRVTQLEQDPVFENEATVGDVVGHDRQAISLADRLGLKDPEARCSALSGGQRKRLALAVALGAECDLLILDEPTNHLDVDSIDWLEEHLRSRREALLLVTHDRFLLDRVVNRVIEVHDQNLYSHQGTYEDYLEAAATRLEQQTAAEHRLQQRIKTELTWLRRSPKARTTKSRARVNRTQDLLAQQRRSARSALTIDLPSRRIGSKVVELHNAGKRYGDLWVLRHVGIKLQSDARIGIVGPNGAGKTTLLSLMARRIASDEGSIAVGATIHSGWYGQEPRPIPLQTRVQAAVRAHVDDVLLESGIRVSAGQLLERFQFTRDQQQSEVGDLSGGERRRLELVFCLLEAPNLLFLDEPTNDLDIDTLNILEEYLDAWSGAVVTATHDRYFLDRTCSDIYSIEADGSVRHHPGGWTAYRESVVDRPTAPERSKSADTRLKPIARKLGYQEQRELEELVARLPVLESRRAELEAQLHASGSSYSSSVELSTKLAGTLEALDHAETRWLELTEKAERLAT